MKKYIAIIIAVLAFVSCNEWLDGTENNTYLTDELVWKDEASAQLYVNGFYTYLSKYGQFGTYQFGGSMTESLTDTFKYGSLSLGHKAGHPNNYVVNPEAITTAGCLWGIWGTAYENIRRVNGFLDSMHKFSKLSPEKNALLEAQARFFRAFIYFQLAKRHPKGVILYDTLPVGNDKALSSADETWQFIYDDLKFANVFFGSSDAAALTQGGITATCLAAMDPTPADYYHNRRDNYDRLVPEAIQAGFEIVLSTIFKFDEEGLSK